MPGFAGRAGVVEEMPADRPAGDWLPEADATLAHALFTAQPRQHPFWNQYVIFVCHLRDIPGQSRPAVRSHPEDTHNLMVITVNPEIGPVKAADCFTWYRERWQLQPLNYSEFLRNLTDEQAVEVFNLACRAFAEGLFIVEPEGIGGARDFVKRSLAETCDHVRDGTHSRAKQ